MVVHRRVIAAASALAVVAALAVAVGGQASSGQSSGAGVTFTSEPLVAALVGHWVVTPSARSGAGSAVNAEGQMPLHFPKGKPAVSGSSSSGVKSNNNVSDSAASPSTATASSSFVGQQASNKTCSYFAHGCNPPDMALAASPSLVLQGVNTQWEVFDTAGNPQPGWPVSAQSFFGAANQPCDAGSNFQPFLSDPRALYDPVDHRFWAAMLQVEDAFGVATTCPVLSVYYVAVSQTSDPSGSWNVYEFDMTAGQTAHGQPAVADFTQLGINSDAVYFSANMFSQDGNSYDYAELFEANKGRMEKGQGNFTADGFFNLQATGPGTSSSTGPFLADTVQPSDNLDGSAGAGEKFVDTFDGPDPVNGHFCGFFGGGFKDACSGLAMWTMSNPTAHDRGGAAPTLTAAYVPTQPFVFSPAADEPGCKQCVDASDLRISATPVIRNGVLYAGWETGTANAIGSVPGIIWAQVNLSAVDSTVSGYYNFNGGAAASYPALMPDANGNVTMLFEHMSSTVNPETRYITKSATGDFTGGGVVLKAGEDPYRPDRCGSAIPVCRWGDFEATSFDGSGRIWFAGEYANTFDPNAPQFGRNWGTWIGAISAS